MRTFKYILAALVGFTALTAHANGPWVVRFQDEKLPTQVETEHDQIVNPIAASSSLLKSGAAISSVAATTISTFSAQPDFPRNVTLTPTGTTSNVAAGTAVVSGLSIFGKAISENFAITSTQSTATTGSKAFKSVSSVVFPQASGSSVTLSIGVGSKMGLRRCLDQAGFMNFDVYGGVYAATRGTVAVDSTHIESNTYTPNSAADGAHNLDIFYIQNFRCYPGQ